MKLCTIYKLNIAVLIFWPVLPYGPYDMDRRLRLAPKDRTHKYIFEQKMDQVGHQIKNVQMVPQKMAKFCQNKQKSSILDFFTKIKPYFVLILYYLQYTNGV